MRTIGVVTVGRSDYGIYLPILRRIQADPDLRLHLIVSGAHLAPGFGLTVNTIQADGFEIGDRIEMLLASDSPEGIAKSTGIGVIGFAQAFARFRPDILLVLGDRFEMHAAALAALPFNIPVAHIHGGEVTQGAMDDALRHSLTKLSHLHFVSTPEYALRVAQLGEEGWRITVSGAPSLDNLLAMALPTREQLETQFGFCLQPAPLLVTFHPVTLEFEQTEWQIAELTAALNLLDVPVIFTMPNADTRNGIIRHHIAEYVRAHTSAWSVENFGTQNYFGVMQFAAAMVGNSSSGIIEAPSFKLPVVNIGTRQAGRMRAANVVDVGYARGEIVAGVRRAMAPEFHAKLRDLVNPYGDGHAAERIVAGLKAAALDDRLIRKVFCDVGVAE
ncbi:MAG: UDP-N-acetylglucosamine 2-epimerase (hydrolyzing) [Candidatus Atribacteria bacterium]|nr:UDP-N-acetylglucosamine 2-epimerase (hydrolyzing) [Candidatus Atribacteria bacterium]